MTTTSYSVVGLRSAADMAAFIDRVAGMAGVTGVEVDLGRDAPSQLAIRADGVLSSGEVGDWANRAGVRVLVTRQGEGSGSSTDLHRMRVGPSSRGSRIRSVKTLERTRVPSGR